MSESDETAGFLSALRAGDSLDFWGNRQPLCPHCGAEYDISRNDHWELYSDYDRHEATCPNCDRAFLVITHTKHTFSTDEQDDLPEPQNNAPQTAETQAKSTTSPPLINQV